jgi:hypothetical protein
MYLDECTKDFQRIATYVGAFTNVLRLNMDRKWGVMDHRTRMLKAQRKAA